MLLTWPCQSWNRGAPTLLRHHCSKSDSKAPPQHAMMSLSLLDPLGPSCNSVQHTTKKVEKTHHNEILGHAPGLGPVVLEFSLDDGILSNNQAGSRKTPLILFFGTCAQRAHVPNLSPGAGCAGAFSSSRLGSVWTTNHQTTPPGFSRSSWVRAKETTYRTQSRTAC